MSVHNPADGALKKVFFGMAVFLLLFAFGCSDDPGSEEEVTVVANVNGQKLSADHLKQELRFAKRKFRLSKNDPIEPNELLWLKTQTLNQMIQNVLLNQKAAKIGIKVSREEIYTALQKAKSGYTEEEFRRALEIEEISEEQWEEKLENNLLIQKLISEVVHHGLTVSEEKMKSYYERHEQEFQRSEQVRALHIMVKLEGEAQRLQKELESKPELFEHLATEHSLGLEASKGGDLGYFEKGRMPEEFDGVFKQKKNTISNIIQTPYGFHLFKVVDKKPNQKMSYEESVEIIRDKLLQQAQETRFTEWLEKLKGEANIEIAHDVLEEIN